MVIKLLVVMLMCGSNIALAGEPTVINLVIKEHRFIPEEVKVPVGQKIKLVIDNQDPTPEEFESYALNREKVISGGKQGFVFLGPLKAGRYDFMGEFHQATARGVLIAE